MHVIVFFDGLTEPKNPGGIGCCGWMIYRNKNKTVGRKSLGRVAGGMTMTNNIAEYCALGFALKELVDDKLEINKLTILGDSQLVINQVNKEWKCKKEHTRKLRDRCIELLDKLKCSDISIRWIPRELNDGADKLSREAYNLACMEEEGSPVI